MKINPSYNRTISASGSVKIQITCYCPAGLTVDNIGSSGEDGVSFWSTDRYRRTPRFCTALDLSWQALDPSVPVGAKLSFDFAHSESELLLGIAHNKKVTIGWQEKIDFSPIGATSQTVSVYLDDNLATESVGHTGPAAVSSAPANGFLLEIQDSAPVGTYSWSEPVMITIPGVNKSAVFGNSLVIFPDDPSVVVEVLTRVDMLVRDISEVTLIDVSTVLDDVCCNIVGDINHDSNGPDIGDLVSLVNYMFSGGAEPGCMEEADINGDGSGPDIGDLVSLVNYMFSGGPAPVPCGQAAAGIAKVVPVSSQSYLEVDYDDYHTIVRLNTAIDLRGLQIELAGSGASKVVKLCDNQVDLVSGIEASIAMIGILDLDGSQSIESGHYDLLQLDGKYDLTQAMAVDANGQTVMLTAAKSGNLPSDYALDPNYPNPFNPVTTIGFSLPQAGEVSLDIFNLLGQQVRTLIDRRLSSGRYRLSWDGTDDNSETVTSGVYFYRLKTDDNAETRKMLLLK